MLQTEDKVCFTLKNNSISSSEIILISYSKYVEIMFINSMHVITPNYRIYCRDVTSVRNKIIVELPLETGTSRWWSQASLINLLLFSCIKRELIKLCREFAQIQLFSIQCQVIFLKDVRNENVLLEYFLKTYHEVTWRSIFANDDQAFVFKIRRVEERPFLVSGFRYLRRC